MRRHHPLVGLCLLSLAIPAAAEIYRWEDSDGRVHFTDQPPPNVKRVQQLPAQPQPGDPNVAKLREATAKAPVVLYTGDCGQVCKDAESYLKGRGIPYTTRLVDKDLKALQDLKQLTGGNGVPVVVIGGSAQKGFQQSTWETLLTVAGYPKAKTR
jgi:glutaredoxin